MSWSKTLYICMNSASRHFNLKLLLLDKRQVHIRYIKYFLQWKKVHHLLSSHVKKQRHFGLFTLVNSAWSECVSLLIQTRPKWALNLHFLMEKALFWIENMYFSWFEVENTLKWMCLLQTCSHCTEKYYAAHTQKKWVGKPFDWSLVKKKVKYRYARATRCRVDVAIELEPVNAVDRFHRKTEWEWCMLNESP